MVIGYGHEYVVAGAGFAGAVLARELADRGKSVLVCERREHVGGNAYDYLNEKGVLVHKYGPHLFNTNSDEVVSWLSRFTDWRPYEHRVVAELEGYGNVPVPVNRTTLEMVFDVELDGDQETQEFLDAIRFTHIERPRNVEEAVLAQVGRELYELLFEPYTIKMWGRHPTELKAEVVGRLPVRTDRDDRYFTSSFQAMPEDGYAALFDRMLDHPAIEVQLGVELRPEDLRGDEATLIWTGCLDEAFCNQFGPLPWRSLTFTNDTFPVKLGHLVQETGVVNTPSADNVHTRSTEYPAITGQVTNWTTISYETPSATGDPYYPVPSDESRELADKYLELAHRKGVVPLGRLGTYKYLAMHQAVGQALRLARRLN